MSSRSWYKEVPLPPASATHDVLNQSRALPDWDVYSEDAALVDAVRMHGASGFENHLITYGKQVGSETTRRRHRDANENPPVLQQFDKFGNRVDQVVFHPAYHALMAASAGAEVPSLAWREAGASGVHAARAALSLLNYQADYGVACPMSMTFAGVPALQAESGVAAEWVPRLTSPQYDPRDIPAGDKRGATVGMSMTEKQGGSDVRANTTTATPLDSNDGSRNTNFRVMRLKNKMGDRSNASSEVEYAGAWAQRVGPPGRGVSVIVDMVVCTRLDCALGSAGLQRQALRHAMHHARGRSAFGTRLWDAPAMRGLLGDLAVESEASVAMAMYTASLFDAAEAAPGDEAVAALRRLVTAVVKYSVTKRTPHFVYEAMEAHGGNGYVYEWDMPRMFLQSPLNSIWEGSGNTIVLDILRTLTKEPAAFPALMAALQAAAEVPRAPLAYAGAVASLASQATTVSSLAAAGDVAAVQFAGRGLVDAMATTLAAAALITRQGALSPLPDTDSDALAAVASTFCASRLPGMGVGTGQRANFGAWVTGQATLPDIDAVLARY